MGRNYQKTHEKLLESAKKSFLQDGYERSNLRKICSEANITTGAFYRHFEDKDSLFAALVSPVITDMIEMYNSASGESYTSINSKDITQLWETNERTVHIFLDYIYDHFEVFKLLLTCADGTSHSDFLNRAVEFEVKQATEFFRFAQQQGICVNVIEEEALHILINSYFSSLAEFVVHDYPKKAAIKHSKILVRFFNAGWKEILGI